MYGATRHPKLLLALVVFMLSAGARARADAALLLEEPFGEFGAMNPTGHAAIYFSGICAQSPTMLRPCAPGEPGAVLSRYHRVGGYDWLAVPLIAYLYAVDDSSEIPSHADPGLEVRLRDTYRREHLLDLVPDDPTHEIPPGEWVQLIGASYDRTIYGYEVKTTPEQDAAMIRRFNLRRNRAHFNLLFHNCANFSESVLNSLYPHSVQRNFVADAGVMTPKQVAKSLVRYSREHRSDELRTFVIPQVPGSIKRSTPVDGVLESLLKSKKYVLPLAALHPYVAGTLLAAYIGDGRFHPDPHARIYDAALEPQPGVPPPPRAIPGEATAPTLAGALVYFWNPAGTQR